MRNTIAWVAALCLLTNAVGWAQEPQPPAPGAKAVEALDLQAEAAPVLQRALSFLESTQQPDGGWLGFGQQTDPAITALVAKCFIQSPGHGPRHPIVRRAVALILTYAKEDGGIYVEGRGLRNYETSVCLMALAALNDSQYRPRIEAAQQFLTTLQWDEAEGHEADSPWYGGAGYGRHKRPDLSNTQMMLEALTQSGLPPEHPAYRKAVVFIQRCQMLSLTNDQPFAAGSREGGFIYTPVSDGQSKAGTVTVEGRPRLRCYGSMTYSGFKSLLYANVSRDDVRVRRALHWILNNYTLEHNPNMPGEQSQAGLYYYYFVFAKALAAWGEQELTDTAGHAHRWRQELCSTLKKCQRDDGSFVNPADRWMEGNPCLVTAYSVLAIQTALAAG